MAKIQRNDPCPCGKEGMKYKNCCLFMRHGGERIEEKLYSGYDLVKETVKRLMDANHVEKMNEIIKGTKDVRTDQ